MQIFTQKTEGSTLGDSQASQNKTMKFFFVYYGNLDFFWQLLPTSCIVGVWFWPMKLQQTLSLLVDLNLNPLVWSVVMQIKLQLQPLVWNWRESFPQPIYRNCRETESVSCFMIYALAAYQLVVLLSVTPKTACLLQTKAQSTSQIFCLKLILSLLKPFVLFGWKNLSR